MRLAQALRVARGEVLALTGGGGKTTAMFGLANELASPASPKLRGDPDPEGNFRK